MKVIAFGSYGYEAQLQRWSENHKHLDTKVYLPQDIKPLEPYLYGHRGFGFWLWKSFIILEAIKTNEQVLYCDSDYQITDFDGLKELIGTRDKLLIKNDYNVNRLWTKRDCYYFMDADTPEYHEAVQIEAGLQYWTNTAENIRILEEHLAYGKVRAIISDDPNICGLPNLPGFRDHRHDQSIMSILQLRYNIDMIPAPMLRKGILEGMDYFETDGVEDEDGHWVWRRIRKIL